MLIGIISDTHGALPDSIAAAFEGVERIVHAGDVGGQRIIDELETVAPVVAVRGNMDTGELEWRLPEKALLKLGDFRVLVIHNASWLGPAGVPEGVDVVVSGHTHSAKIEEAAEVLFVNPGSAGGKNREGAAATAAILDLSGDRPVARIVEL